MLLNMNISNRIDFLTVQKTIIPGEKFCVFALYLSDRNCIFGKFLVILNGSLIQFIKLFALVVGWRTDKNCTRIFFISSKITQIIKFDSVLMKILWFVWIPGRGLQVPFGQCTVNSGIFSCFDASKVGSGPGFCTEKSFCFTFTVELFFHSWLDSRVIEVMPDHFMVVFWIVNKLVISQVCILVVKLF